jgi:cofilin
MSGIAVSEDCVSKFNELKLGHAHRYVLFKMNADNTEVVVEKTGSSSETYSSFAAGLPKDHCRYALFDYEYQIDGGRRDKILFILWAPDTAPIREKMIFTSTKDSIKKKLTGLQVEIQATDASELAEEVILEKVSRGA